MREPSRRAQDRLSARARARTLALLAALAGAGGAAGCSNLLGIEDPTPAFGGDGGQKMLTALVIEPSPLNLPLGVTLQLRATGMFDDGTSDDLTDQVEFALAAGDTLTVQPNGLVMAIAQGESTVTATLGRVTGNAVATVGVAVPERLTLSLGDFTVARQQRVRVRVTAVLTDGTMRDETANAIYGTDNAQVATAAAGQIDAGTTAGMATISASLPGATPGTVKVTVAPRNCHPVINELQTGTDANPADEWVEVLNPCTTAVDMTGWTLVYRAANTTGTLDTALLYAFSGSLAAGELRLYAGEGYAGVKDGGWMAMSGQLQQNSAAVALRSGPASSVGTLVDSIAYGAVAATSPFIEGTPMAAMSNNKAAQRRPFDGNDQNQNSTDFTIVDTPTPRAPNVP